MISIIVPYHETPETAFFLKRNLDSIMAQTYRDFEVIHMKLGSMPVTANEAIKRAKGDIIKILPMDDYFCHKNALELIVGAFNGGWMMTGCIHHSLLTGKAGDPHLPKWNEPAELLKGYNTLGGLSVLAFKNDDPVELFDENLSWLIDVDFYYRLYKRYGEPVLLDDLNVVNGIGNHQMTMVITDQRKAEETRYVREKQYE